MKVLLVCIAILIQHTAYKWARDRPKYRLLGVIMMVVACAQSLVLLPTILGVLGSLGLLALSLVLIVVANRKREV